MAIIKQDIKKGITMNWGASVGEIKGYTVNVLTGSRISDYITGFK